MVKKAVCRKMSRSFAAPVNLALDVGNLFNGSFWEEEVLTIVRTARNKKTGAINLELMSPVSPF
jgi:hypothetical protein